MMDAVSMTDEFAWASSYWYTYGYFRDPDMPFGCYTDGAGQVVNESTGKPNTSDELHC